MNEITANIVVACQTAGAVNSVSKLKFALAQLTRYAVKFATESISVFSELEEATQKFNVVFAGLGKESKRVVDDLVKGFGQSELSAKTMLGATGDLLTGFGMAKDQALDMAEAAAKLGSDLASFANYAGDAEGATNALTKAMLGERDALKPLGVVIREDDASYKKLTKQAMSTGVTIKALNKTFKVDSLQQAQAVATLALAYQQSKNAIGDFARSSDSIANSSRSLENRFIELKASVGGFLNEILRVGSVKGGLADSLLQLTDSLKARTPEWSLAVNKFVLSTKLGFELIWQLGSAVMENICVVGVYAYDVLTQAWKDTPGFFGALWQDVTQTFLNSFNLYRTIYWGAFEFFGKVLVAFGQTWWNVMGDIAKVALHYIEDLRVMFSSFFKGLISVATTFAKNFVAVIRRKMSAKEAFAGLQGAITDAYNNAANAMNKNWEGVEFGKHGEKLAESITAAGGDYSKKIGVATAKLREEVGTNLKKYLEDHGVVRGEFKDIMAIFKPIIDKYDKQLAALKKQAAKESESESKDSQAKNIANTFAPNMSKLREDFTRSRATAQRAIMANSTEAITLQSRNFSTNNYQDVMLRETKKQSSALESINRNTRDSKLKITSVKLG